MRKLCQQLNKQSFYESTVCDWYFKTANLLAKDSCEVRFAHTTKTIQTSVFVLNQLAATYNKDILFHYTITSREGDLFVP